ncbi:MAG: tripartite tricarboxylate transporter substrate-binding protein [Burkholderiaceae bacterium]
MQRRRFLGLSASGGLAALGLSPRLSSAAVTTRPSRFVVGFAPGGGTDTIARMVADAVGSQYPGGLIVENKPGAASRIAVETVKAADADGSTLLVTPDFALTVYPHSFAKLGYDPLKDLVAVAPVALAGIALCAGPMVPATVRTPVDYLDWVKANPAMSSFGSPGAGSSFHFAGLMLGKARGIELNHIAYKGGAPALQDVIGGQIPANVCAIGEALQFIKAGNLRALGTFGTERDRFAPETPTMVESGFKDVVAQAWIAVFAPAKTPADVVARTAAALNAATSGGALTDRLAGYGMRPLTMSSGELAAMLRGDLDRWGPVVKASGFKAQD